MAFDRTTHQRVFDNNDSDITKFTGFLSLEKLALIARMHKHMALVWDLICHSSQDTLG